MLYLVLLTVPAWKCMLTLRMAFLDMRLIHWFHRCNFTQVSFWGFFSEYVPQLHVPKNGTAYCVVMLNTIMLSSFLILKFNSGMWTYIILHAYWSIWGVKPKKYFFLTHLYMFHKYYNIVPPLMPQPICGIFNTTMHHCSVFPFVAASVKLVFSSMFDIVISNRQINSLWRIWA